MASTDSFPNLDDQSLALQLQLEELDIQRELQHGKWTEDSPADFALAFDYFAAELKRAIAMSQDLKFAHSIANAFDPDAIAIEELGIQETRSIKDRVFALSLNEGATVPSQNVSTLQETSLPRAESVDWDYVLRTTPSSTLSIESCSTIAGPSVGYAERQKAVLEQLPQLKVDCSVCRDSFHPHATARLLCGDVYCKPCLKAYFLRVAKDESLFPPTCHRQPVDISLIEEELSIEELTTYRSAELEFNSTNRVYCAATDCARFIPPPQRTPDHAFCEACDARTCMHCKSLEHDGVRPLDEARQGLLDFASEQGWKPCFGCGEMVFRYEGCDHMTCRCSAQFCYRCGVKWKDCQCGDWEPGLLTRRAQQVVDREAMEPLRPLVRQQRVRAMEMELETNHECNHSGKFSRIEGSRRGQVCEICGTRHWKYILSCKRCHMLACEECRRYRI